VQVVLEEDLDRTVHRVGGIGCRRAIRDPIAGRLQFRKPHGECLDAARIPLDDHLKRDDLVARAKNADDASVPCGIASGRRMIQRVTLDLFAIVDRPYAPETGVCDSRDHQHGQGNSR